MTTPPSDALERHFSRVDTDANGLIDLQEFQALLQSLGLNRSSEVIAHAFKAIDRDNSGAIDQQEFARWWSAQEHPKSDTENGADNKKYHP